jgi:hypothetical protein
MNVQEFELCTDDALRHNPSQILDQEPHTAVLREREGVETRHSEGRSVLHAKFFTGRIRAHNGYVVSGRGPSHTPVRQGFDLSHYSRPCGITRSGYCYREAETQYCIFG